MTPKLYLADQIVIVGYFLLLASVGFYFWRRMKRVADLFTGGNNIPWWLAGVSFYLTSFSAFTFIGYSELAYRYGFVSVVLTWAFASAMLFGTIFLAKPWRRARIISPIEFLEARYSTQIRQTLAWAGLPLKLVDDGLKIYATGIFVSIGLGYDLQTSVVVCGIVMSLYTFMGGLWAVVITDYVQFVILNCGVCVLFPLVFSHMGGLLNGLKILSRQSPGFLAPFHYPLSFKYVAAFYVLALLSFNGNWASAQKFYSVRNEREARKAGVLATFLKLLGPVLFLLPAMAARNLMPELLQPPNSPQYTYAALSVKYLPAGLLGLMIAAMFSATMSTLSGDFNVIASVLTEDVYRRLFHPQASQRRLLLVGRIATLLVGGATVGIGVILVNSTKGGLFEIMVTLFNLFVGPMLIPMLVGLLSRRVTWRGAAAGITCGFLCSFSLYLYKILVLAKQPGIDPMWLRYSFEAYSIFANAGITLLAITVTTLVERPTSLERSRIGSFFARIDTPISTEKERAVDPGSVISPLPIIGWITIGVALLLLIAAATLGGSPGRSIDIGMGIFLSLVGVGFHLLNRTLFRAGSSSVLVPEESVQRS